MQRHLDVSYAQIGQAIVLGVETRRLRFAGLPPHSINVTWQPADDEPRP